MTKKILSVALTVLMLLVVAFPVNAATEVSTVQMRGTVANGTGAQSWNAQTFAGFYYDIKYDRSTEDLNVISVDGTTIQKDNLWYNTTTALVDLIVDEGIGQAPAGASDAEQQKAVYFKTKTIIGESDALLFTVYVDTIFSGATSDMVQFKYAWLIDETSAKEIKNNDKYGVFEVRTSNADDIKLGNENTVSLSKNTETTLMGEIKFKTADNDTMRYYPKVDYVITTEGGNVTPTVTGTAPRGTPGINVTGTATATITARPTEAATPLGTAATVKPPVTTTTTVPGFEAMFAVAGLLAVAYLVLRRRK